MLPTLLVQAQLTDNSQTMPQVPGGAIGKSLQEQIGTGRGDEFTPGSSLYLITRDPARAIRRERQLFQRKFTAHQGVGPRVNGDSTGNIQANPGLGAGLSDSCASCHGRPRGSAGVGGDVATRPDSRDAPHLFGLGLVEMLADEVTTDLRAIRAAALRQSQVAGRPDTSQVQGVDPDLRVKPFFAQGKTISIREFIIGAFQDEMGLQTADPFLCAVTSPSNPQRLVSPAGFMFDPAYDTFARPPVCHANQDGDRDGVVNEIDPALVDHMEFYLLNYFKPGRSKIDSFVQQGLQVFERIGCTTCHVQKLSCESAV